MEKTNIIPIDDKLNLFAEYLANNDRAILSARFGDGKTFFLEELKKSLSKEYHFLTLYPVLYQVADNKDIFEYIKRDILIQLLMSGDIVLDDNKYSYIESIEGFLSTNFNKIINDAISEVAPLLTFVPKEMIDMLQKNISRFREYHSKIDKSQSDTIEDYINSFTNQTGGIYEFDPISRLIWDLLSDLKKQTNKKVVLVVEDLDRIDPAHIFRIMNILSAHWDMNDYSETKLSFESVSNKYNFDKVLLVCHYQNIKNIFHHFYGRDTDFTGYIHKYSPVLPFEYSLKTLVRDWIIDHLPSDFTTYEYVKQTIADLILSRYWSSEGILTNLRHITTFFSKNVYRINTQTISFNTKNYHLESNNRVTKLLCILKEFQITIDFFFNQYKSIHKNDKRHIAELSEFIGPCWLLHPYIDKGEDVIHFDACAKDTIDCKIGNSSMYFNINVITVLSDNNRFPKANYIIKEIDVSRAPQGFNDVNAMKRIFEKCEEYIY